MTDTPRTDEAEGESIAVYKAALGPSAVFPCDGYDFARELERELAAERGLADRLIRAAQAVVDRWETPFWKDAPHTSKFIRSLDDALAAWKEARK